MTLDEIASRADVVTFHTPHTIAGEDATHHLADSRFFTALRRAPIIINAARGPVVDTKAILEAVRARKVSGCVIDCWEGEPAVSSELLRVADIATPHIAGYSIEGKRRATVAVVSAALRFFGEPADNLHVIPQSLPGTEITPETILASYNPFDDTAVLKSGFTPSRFETLRNTYPLRHEVGF